mgnify:CR=1 FL=1
MSVTTAEEGLRKAFPEIEHRERSIEVTGNKEIPQVLSQIGVYKLIQHWKSYDEDKKQGGEGKKDPEDSTASELSVIGRQRVRKLVWEQKANNGDGGYITKYKAQIDAAAAKIKSGAIKVPSVPGK